MDYASRMEHYRLASAREEEAAARAGTRESARLHGALAEMYRHEAAKMDSVRRTLRVALG